MQARLNNLHMGYIQCMRPCTRVGACASMQRGRVVLYYKLARPAGLGLRRGRTHAHGTCHLEYVPPLLYILELYSGI